MILWLVYHYYGQIQCPVQEPVTSLSYHTCLTSILDMLAANVGITDANQAAIMASLFDRGRHSQTVQKKGWLRLYGLVKWLSVSW